MTSKTNIVLIENIIVVFVLCLNKLVCLSWVIIIILIYTISVLFMPIYGDRLDILLMMVFDVFLTLVDDSGRFTWVYFLKHKSDCLTLIPKFFKHVENQFNTTIKVFRSNMLKNYIYMIFFSNKGVIHQLFVC